MYLILFFSESNEEYEAQMKYQISNKIFLINSL